MMFTTPLLAIYKTSRPKTHDLQTLPHQLTHKAMYPTMKEYKVFASIYRLLMKIDKLGHKPHLNTFNSFKEYQINTLSDHNISKL